MGNLNQSDSMVLLDAHYTGNRAQSKAKKKYQGFVDFWLDFRYRLPQFY